MESRFYQVLEKILNRVYAKKSEASTQCDEYTIIQATISETETFKASELVTVNEEVKDFHKHRKLSKSKFKTVSE